MKREKDYNAILFKNLRNLNKLIWRIICKIFMHTNGWLKKIKIGKKCAFNGLMYFQRSAFSNIIIGRNCIFNSSPVSALLGINHKCIVATIQEGASIKIGDNCGFSGTTITAATEIVFGNKVRCGANTTINDSDWHFNDPRSTTSQPITIKDNVWLGSNVTVLKGVTIGENSVIGVGSLVVQDIPANVVAIGNPCRVVKSIPVHEK